MNKEKCSIWVNIPLTVIFSSECIVNSNLRPMSNRKYAKEVISLCKQETFINWYAKENKPIDYHPEPPVLKQKMSDEHHANTETVRNFKISWIIKSSNCLYFNCLYFNVENIQNIMFKKMKYQSNDRSSLVTQQCNVIDPFLVIKEKVTKPWSRYHAEKHTWTGFC